MPRGSEEECDPRRALSANINSLHMAAPAGSGQIGDAALYRRGILPVLRVVDPVEQLTQGGPGHGTFPIPGPPHIIAVRDAQPAKAVLNRAKTINIGHFISCLYPLRNYQAR